MTRQNPPARAGTAIAVLASGATFLAMLDTTVTNLAIADLHRDFTTASVSGLTWVITVYAVTFSALLAPAGRLADVVGRRPMFRAGIGLFTLASLLCSLAPDLSVLLVARGVQGAGAAAMIPASLGVLLHDAPAEHRVRSVGLWSAAGALAAAVGPSLGGVLVNLLHWRSLFYINLPIGLAIIVFARIIPGSNKGERVDRTFARTAFAKAKNEGQDCGTDDGRGRGEGEDRIFARAVFGKSECKDESRGGGWV